MLRETSNSLCGSIKNRFLNCQICFTYGYLFELLFTWFFYLPYIHPSIQISAQYPSQSSIVSFSVTFKSTILLSYYNKQVTSLVETCPIYFASYYKWAGGHWFFHATRYNQQEPPKSYGKSIFSRRSTFFAIDFIEMPWFWARSSIAK